MSVVREVQLFTLYSQLVVPATRNKGGMVDGIVGQTRTSELDNGLERVSLSQSCNLSC